MTSATFVIAASVALAWLAAEQGLARCETLRKVAGSPRRLAQLLMGALSLGTMAGALALLLVDAAYHSGAWVIGFVVAVFACTGLLRYRHRVDTTVMPWLVAMLAPLFLALACIGKDAHSGLLGGFALAFALGLGLPAFSALAQRLDDPDVPAMMRPLPVRMLATGILALSMAGSLSW